MKSILAKALLTKRALLLGVAAVMFSGSMISLALALVEDTAATGASAQVTVITPDVTAAFVATATEVLADEAAHKVADLQITLVNANGYTTVSATAANLTTAGTLTDCGTGAAFTVSGF